MKKVVICILSFIIVITSCCFAKVYVKGYFRKDGTYVAPHYRTNPDNTITNNYSYPGNYNPNTGKITGGTSTYSPSYTMNPLTGLSTTTYIPSVTSTSSIASSPSPTPQPVESAIATNELEVIKTTYPVKINNQDISKFTLGWPSFIYEDITYIPLTSYLVNELNLKLDFNNETGLNLSNQQIPSTVGESSANVSDLDYTDYFYIYSKADSLKDSLNQLRNSFTDNYSYYNFSYYDRNYYSLLKDNLSLVKLDASLVDSILKSEDLFVELCVKHNIATEKEVREIFNNAENYAFSLNLIAGNMEFNAAKLDYSFGFTNGVNLSRDGLYEILTPLSEIEQKAFSKFYE